MDKLELLEKKIRQAADELLTLKHENRKLNASIKFMENEHKRASELIRVNGTLLDDKKLMAHRIEKVLKKLTAVGM